MTVNTAADETAALELRENIDRAEERIRLACELAGRRREEVKLVAASKLNGSERIRLAHRLGLNVFGENRVQELCEKREQGAYEGCELHLIGHLQRNKARFVAGQVALIESADSLELLRELEKLCAKNGSTQDVLLEVNLLGEESKTGLAPAALPQLLEAAGDFSRVHIRGLMGIPPKSENTLENRRYFARMHQLFIDISEKKYDNVQMAELSMGMSADFEDAIAEGATLVRLGTALFGARDYGTLGCI